MIGRIDIGGAALDAFRTVNDAAGGALNLLDDAGRLFGESTVAAGLGLAETYAARTGILRPYSFTGAGVLGTSIVSVAANVAARGGDRAFDGFFVGASGRTYPPSTPLREITPVLPRGGRVTTDETIVYVNGISTTVAGQSASLRQIADRTGARVVGLHNATEGTFLDIIQSAGDTLDIGRNPAVDALADLVYDEITAGRTIHLMAHSQGGLITSRALQDVRNRLMIEDGLSRRDAERMLGRVRVETFGGAAGGYPDGPQYVHYVNRLDPVPSLFGLGPFPNPFVRAGRGAVVHRFNENDNVHGFEATYLPRRVPFEQARRGDFD